MKLLPSGVMYGFVVSEGNNVCVCVCAYRKRNSVTRLQRGYYIGARQEAFCKKSKHRSWERRTRTYELLHTGIIKKEPDYKTRNVT